MTTITYKQLLKHNLKPARSTAPLLKIRFNKDDHGVCLTSDSNPHGNPDNYGYEFSGSKIPTRKVGEIIRALGNACCNPYSRKGCKETITLVVKVAGKFYRVGLNSDALDTGGIATVWE